MLQTVGVVAIITAIIAGIVLLIKNWDKAKEAVTKLWSHIKEKFNAIKETITGAFTKAKEAVTNKVKEIGDSIKNSTIGQAASKVFNGVKDTVHNVMSAATETAKERLGNRKRRRYQRRCCCRMGGNQRILFSRIHIR